MNLVTTDKKNGFPLNMRLLKTLQDQRLALEKLCNLFGKFMKIVGIDKLSDASSVYITGGYLITAGKLVRVRSAITEKEISEYFKPTTSTIKQDDLEGSRSECFKETVYTITDDRSNPEAINIFRAFKGIPTLKSHNSFMFFCQFTVEPHKLPYTNFPGNETKPLEEKSKYKVKINPLFEDANFEMYKEYVGKGSRSSRLILQLDVNHIIFAETIYDPNIGNRQIKFASIHLKRFTVGEWSLYAYDGFKDYLEDFGKSKVLITIFKITI